MACHEFVVDGRPVESLVGIGLVNVCERWSRLVAVWGCPGDVCAVPENSDEV